MQHIKDTYHCKNILILDQKTQTDDSTVKCILNYSKANQTKFMLVSRVASSKLVTRNYMNAENVCSRVSSKTAAHIATPQTKGAFREFSYAIYPYYNSLSSLRILRAIENYSIFPKIISWHKNLVLESKRPVTDQEIPKISYELSTLKTFFDNDREISLEILSASNLVEKRKSQLYSCISHNDLWRGNILKNSKFIGEIKVIDWAGMSLDGNPFFDLSKLLISFNINRHHSQSLYNQYRQLFECDTQGMGAYFYISMARLLANIDNFPETRFRNLVRECKDHISKYN